MKPRTKLQMAVVKSAEMLPPLTEYQRQQAIEKASIRIAKLDSKGNYTCLECGHQWQGAKADTTVCPLCGSKLHVDTSRKKKFQDSDYFVVVRKCNGFQVVRTFFINTALYKGKQADRFIREAFQKWITPTGKTLIVGRRRHWLAYYCDSWDWTSGMELRDENEAHRICTSNVVGKVSVIPEIERNGFDGDFHGCSPWRLFSSLLTDNRIETLWKVGQYELAKHLMKTGTYCIDKHWPSIRVALKHGYKIDDGSIWIDLLRFLSELGKDVRNPKFICPADLKAAHNEWHHRFEAKCEKERERRLRQQQLAEQERYLRDVENAMKEQSRYEESKSRFFDLQFADGEITVKPLVSIQEFIDEGKLMHHCVFSNKYYKQEDSLIFHALVGGISVATIELNLTSLEIVQCRGKHNIKPEQYDRIVNLINKNKNKIAQKTTA